MSVKSAAGVIWYVKHVSATVKCHTTLGLTIGKVESAHGTGRAGRYWRGLAILLLFGGVCSLGRAQPPSEETCEQAGRRIVSEWIRGYNEGDATGVAALYTDDAYYLTQHFTTGIVHGRAAIQAYVQHGVDARYHVDSIETLHLDCSDTCAYAITRYHSTNAGTKAFGVNVVVLKNVGGVWKIVAHEAAVPEPTAIRELEISDPR